MDVGGSIIKCLDFVDEELKPNSSFNVPCILNPNKTNCQAGKELKPILPLSISRLENRNYYIAPVTTVLSVTKPAMAQYNLERWKDNMIKRFGYDKFKTYQAKNFERGKLLHALVAKYLMSFEEAKLSNDIVKNLWKSIKPIVEGKINNVRLIEHAVTHPEMNYRGIVDCVAFFEDELVVIEFKTSDKPRNNIDSLYDGPLQVAAYCGAINFDSTIPNHVIDRNISSGVVIVAYVNGSEASIHRLSREKVVNDYWMNWSVRLDQFIRLQEYLKKTKRSSVVVSTF